MKDRHMLQRLTMLISDLCGTLSTDEKKSILLNYKDLEAILTIIYDKNYRFNITGKHIFEFFHSEDYIELEPISQALGLTSILDTLNKKIMGGYLAAQLCGTYLHQNYDYVTTIIKIFNKDLECGISTKTLETVFKKQISSFNIPLANKYKKKLFTIETENWYASRKLDGIRCLSFVKEDSVEFFSRTGKPFTTLDNLKEELLLLREYVGFNFVLDGEVCVVDEQGKENFKDIIKQIRRKDFTIEKPSYFIFDLWGMQDFKYEKDTIVYADKVGYFKLWFYANKQFKKLRYLEQIRLTNRAHLKQLYEDIPNHWEGLIVRKDTYSKFKRSSDLLKLKKFMEGEYKVVGAHNDYKAIEGVQTFCCTSLSIRYKGNIVGVGSGMNDSQRIAWYKAPEKIVGKVITVKYFEETKDKHGKPSLRFPTLKTVQGERREM